MKTYKLEIKEILSKIVEIDADNIDEAYLKVKEKYRNELIVLDSSNYFGTEIEIIENYQWDTRVILSNKLQSIGLSEAISKVIALDAGSSQVVINRNYLLNKGIQNNKLITKIVK